MNKADAAKFLDKSVRAVERYAASGRLPSTLVPGKTGPVADFALADLERLKSELGAVVVRGTVTPDNARQSERADVADHDGATGEDAPPKGDSQALAMLDGGGTIPPAVLARAVWNLAMLGTDKARAVVSVPVESKPLLTLAECQALTGLSRGVLRAAIDAGDLVSKQVGRSWRIKRADLDRYIETL